MNSLFNDLRFGLRMMVRNPVFSLIAIVTLALGIGANTAIFSVVDAVLLRPLPYPNADRLVFLWSTMNSQGVPQSGSALPDYHGWRDQNFSPFLTLTYYKSVLEKMGSSGIADWLRVFLVPGMGHCGGGEGPNAFDPVTALEQWVEKGKAPDQITASHRTDGKVDRTRPLCPYPQVAKYKGSGSIDDAENFSCVAPPPQ